MSNVIQFQRKDVDGSVTYRDVWAGEKGERGEQIVLAHGVWASGLNEYAILYMAPEGSFDGFDIVKRFTYDDASLVLAKFCAEVADRALGSFVMYQPEDGEGAQ